MRARQPLPKHNQGAREDVAALHSDGDGGGNVGVRREVVGAAADARAAEHVHAVVDQLAPALGEVQLHHARQHGGPLVRIQHGIHQRLRAGHAQRLAGHVCQALLHALHVRDGHLELLADACVRAHRVARLPRHGQARCGQRHAPSLRQALHQHVPAVAAARLAADHARHGDEHVRAAHGAVHEGHAQWVVAAADVKAREAARDQCHRDALAAGSQQHVGILELDGKSHDRGDWCERDVALVEGRPDANLALLILANKALVDHGGGVTARRRPCQAKAGNIPPVRQARQVVLLLLRRAVLQQQLCGPQAVGHHDRHRGCHAVAGDARDDLGVTMGGKAQATKLLGDDHAQKLLFLHEPPNLRWKVSILPNGVIIYHLKQLVCLVIKEALLLC
mmetsp:Transcript_22507/g.56456  ORF Transcript_22507/g.56456 Transcript_22507/m.56456 type:complete len:392 (+) Transcript_22507:752-1927(+)